MEGLALLPLAEFAGVAAISGRGKACGMSKAREYTNRKAAIL